MLGLGRVGKLWQMVKLFAIKPRQKKPKKDLVKRFVKLYVVIHNED